MPKCGGCGHEGYWDHQSSDVGYVCPLCYKYSSVEEALWHLKEDQNNLFKRYEHLTRMIKFQEAKR
jgi:hypothetical protein